MSGRAALTPAETAAAVVAAKKAGHRICTAVVTRSADGLTGNRCWIAAAGAGPLGDRALGEAVAGSPDNRASDEAVASPLGDRALDAVTGSLGDRALDAVTGSLGDRALDAAVASAVPGVFPVHASSGVIRRDFDYANSAGVHCVATVYLELHAPPPKLVVVGAGHVAVPLAQIGVMLGLRVEVLDDRPEFADPARFPEADAVRVIDFRDPFADTRLTPPDHVVLVTRGHRFDYECLVRLLRMKQPPGYLGMIGSRRRVRATHEQLAREEFTLEQMSRVRAPVGLDLGGQTPVEIAVSVAAEIVMHRSGGTGAPLFEKERVAERFFGRR